MITKYAVLADEIEAFVQDCAVGDLLPSEAEMMRRFSASRNTYRSAVAVLKQKGLLATRAGYGTYVTRKAPLPSANRLIQVILPSRDYNFWYQMMDGINDALEPQGYRLVYGNSYDDPANEARLLGEACQDAVQGVILMGHYHSVANEALIDATSQVPVVVCNNSIAGVDVTTVLTDDFAGAQEVVGLLAEAGHREIVHLSGADCDSHRRRRDGYLAEMSKRRLDIQVQHLEGGTIADGERAAEDWLVRGDHFPSAVFAVNDFVAIGFVKALRAAGREVPMVVGYGDLQDVMQREECFVSSMCQDAFAIGRTAAEEIIRLDKEPALVREHLLPVKFIDRGLTGPKETRK